MGRSDRRTRTGAMVGAIAMGLALAVAFLAGLFLTFAPVAIGQAVIEVLPGAITVPLIELLRFWAQPLLVIGVAAAFIACGVAAGVAAADPRRRDTTVVALSLAPWLAALVAAVFAREKIDVASTAADAAIGAIVFAATLAWLGPVAGAQDQRVEPDAPESPSRRRVLGGAAAAAALVAAGSLAFGGAIRAAQGTVGGVPAAARRLRARATAAPALPELERVEGLTPRITSNAAHYTVDSALVDPRVDIAAWRLEVRGAVEAPFAITYEEMLDLDAVEQIHTLECISNEVGGDLIGTAIWTGVPLRDLLTRARPTSAAFDVILRSVDGYSDSFTVAKAMEPETLVAYLMNGETLPQDHGYPARVLVPNIYGMKNVKWLSTIEVATFDYRGYWMERGWSDTAIVNTNSRIDVPRRDLRWNGGEVVIAGIAFAGARGISRVEVSTDGGSTWADAALEEPAGPLTWRRWALRWTPPGTGRRELFVRSTDGEGERETARRRDPFPAGATGYDRIEVNVQRA